MKIRHQSTGASIADFYLAEKCVAKMEWGAQWQQPFIHPVLSPRSYEPVTTFAPCDHPCHRGLWWSCKYANNVNLWDPMDKPKPDGEFGHSLVVDHEVTTDENAIQVA